MVTDAVPGSGYSFNQLTSKPMASQPTFTLQLSGPFGSCAFTGFSPSTGSLKIALKRTRPRQRFWYLIGRYCMQEWVIRQGCLATCSPCSLHCMKKQFASLPILPALFLSKMDMQLINYGARISPRWHQSGMPKLCQKG